MERAAELAGAADFIGQLPDGFDTVLDERGQQLSAAQRQKIALASRSATASGLGLGLASLAAGLTVWGVLVLGVAAVGSGVLSRVPLAVLALTALAAFEAVIGLPAAAMQLSHARTAAIRIAEVMDAPLPVTDPADP